MRLIFGVGFSFASVANLSLVAKFYPTEVARAVGLFDTFAGIGLAIGPVVGSILFSVGNFKMPYLVVTLFYCIY